MAKEIMEGLVKTDKGIVKIVGYDGATFVPHISDDYVLSWTNDHGLENPDPVQLQISKGEIAIGEEEPKDPNVLVWIDTGNVSVKYRDPETGTFAEVQSGGGTDDGSVKKHNVSETAHNDIRLLLAGLSERLNAIADSDDTTLDQLSEIVAYIKANKTLIESVTTSKVDVSDIIDNLTTSVSNKPLSAKMGVELNRLINVASERAGNALSDASSAMNLASSAMNRASSAMNRALSAEEIALAAQDEIDKIKENGVPGGGGANTGTGAEEIHIGADEPEDDDIKIWIDPDDDGDGLTAEDVENALGYTPANAETVEDLSEDIADLETEVDNLKENGTGATVDENAVVHNAVGATFPPAQRSADAAFDDYDIDVTNVMADDIFAYIDDVVADKETVTKEIVGKDASETYDVARYTFANREYLAWVKENYPKMYAWKNGDAVKYTQSVSPRINEKAYDKPYIGGSGGTIIETVTVPAKAVVYPGYRYSHSGGKFSAENGVASLIVPLPVGGVTSATIKLTNNTRHNTRSGVYVGETNTQFPIDGAKTTDGMWSTDLTTLTLTPSNYDLTGANFVVWFIAYTDDASLANMTITLDGEPLAWVIGQPSEATQESTTTTEVETEGEAGTPITAVSATRRSRTIDGAEYVRYEDGDVEPTVIYTDKDDDRNSGASITKDGVTYNRYPLGDLGANRTKLTSIFVYANEHGYIPNHTYEGHETKMCALVAARFLRDLASDKQLKNPLYKYIRENCMVVVIPVTNPFGYNINLTGGSGINSGDTASGYMNANRCNINRNYDTPGWDYMHENDVVNDNWYGHYPGSQNETQYIMNTMVESGAVVAMSLHGHSGKANYGAIQGQDPDGTYFNEGGMLAISDFLKSNYGYKLVDYDVYIEGAYPTVGAHNMPDVTCKSPSYITQCGAYGGIVEFSPFEHDATTGVVTHNAEVIENAYAQTINLVAMWLSDYLES